MVSREDSVVSPASHLCAPERLHCLAQLAPPPAQTPWVSITWPSRRREGALLQLRVFSVALTLIFLSITAFNFFFFSERSLASAGVSEIVPPPPAILGREESAPWSGLGRRQ